EVAKKQRLIIGPWTHTDRSGSVGEQSFPSGSENAINLEKLQIDYLLSTVNGDDPQLAPDTLYVMGADQWRTAERWPLQEIVSQEWLVNAERSISVKEHDTTGMIEHRSDPRNPVPTVGRNALKS